MWVECNLESLREAIVGQASAIWEGEITSQRISDKWKELCQKLLATKGKNVIIIDGLEQPDDDLYDSIEDIASTGWNVIVTSRIKLSDYPVFEFNGLTTEGAKQLFRRYFTRPVDEDLLDKIVGLLERHPLLVELVAKAGNANRKLSLRELYVLLSDNKLKSDELQREINVGKHGKKYKAGRQKEIFNYLLLCFDISGLNKAAQKQLLYFSIFPASQPISFDFFLAIIGQEEKDSRVIENAVNKLEENGWINIRGGEFYIHPLIQVVVWEKLGITTQKIKSIAMSCTKRLHGVSSSNPWLFNYEISIAKNILQATELSPSTLYLSIFYSDALAKMGNYQGALQRYELCAEFVAMNFISDPSLCCTIFNNLGNVYSAVGRYDEAASYLMMAIEIHRVSGAEDPISLAHSMDNYAGVLEIIGRYAESASITKEAIKIFKREGSDKDLCQAYINIASAYYHLGKYRLAKRYWRKGFALIGLHSDPSVISSCYNTIGIIFQGQNRYRLAKEAFVKAIKARKQSPNPDDLSLLYRNLSAVQFSLQQYEKGRVNLERAIKLNRSIEGVSSYNEAQLNELQFKFYIYERNYAAAEACLKAILKIYEQLFGEENAGYHRIKEQIRFMRTGEKGDLALFVKGNDLLETNREYLDIFNKLLERIIDKAGAVKVLVSRGSASSLYDYILFCATKGCKSLLAISALIEAGKPEDAMILLYSVYRNYLTIAFLRSNPEFIDYFIVFPILIDQGEIKRPVDDDGIIDVSNFIHPEDNSTKPLYLDLSRLVKRTSYPEDKIVHNYLNPQLSDHVYSNFMTAGNYQDENNAHYRYDNNDVVVQPILMGVYLQILLLHEPNVFIREAGLNRNIDKFTGECVPLLIALIEFGKMPAAIREAMISRLRKTLPGYSGQ